MSKLHVLTGAVLVCLSSSSSMADDSDYSRQDLFFTLQALEQGSTPFALPRAFEFPESARESSKFGIDVSHHTIDQCKCNLEWKSIVNSKVSFVYLKATQGMRYTDPTYSSFSHDIHSQAQDLLVGAYHFMSSGTTPEQQAKHFLDVVQRLDERDLPPSLDLEWDPGPMQQDCPANAVIPLKRQDGSIVEKCDLWSRKTADEIIGSANAWLKAVKVQTGRDGIVYTNTAWWVSRIGKESRFKELVSPLVWIADYSRNGLATEDPRVPGGGAWQFWQFTDRAALSPGFIKLKVDASIMSNGFYNLINQTH